MYSIQQFYDIEKNSDINELNNTTIKIINNIAKKVGSSTYKKTPIFKKKRFEPKNKNNNFKKTNFELKLDEQEIIIDKLRNLLNKLTKNNYEEIKEDIIIKIKHFSYLKNNMVLINICKEIFNISSINKFWCNIYADLFVDLIDNFPIMKNICESNFNTYMNIFDVIEIGKEEEYSEFCKINSTNEKRRALSLFYTCLYENNVLSKDSIERILNKLFSLVKQETNKEVNTDMNKKIVEEIFENILIIVNKLSITDDDKIVDDLKEMYEIITNKNVSKKIGFKLLDFFESNDIEVDE